MPFRKRTEIEARKHAEELMTAVAGRVGYSRQDLKAMDIIDYHLIIQSMAKDAKKKK